MKSLIKSMLLAAAVAASVADATETYEQAEEKAAGHEADVETAQWVEQQMQPAFGPVFGPVLSRCLQSEVARPARLDLVFVVEPAGTVGAVFWKEPEAFSRCLEPGLKAASFPPPPSGEFYFGVGFRLPPRKP